jgi:tetratricopeptide (TPR) repeat protein
MPCCPLSRPLLTVAVALAFASATGCGGGAQERKAAHVERGQAYLAAENYDKALIEFKNALQIDPKDTEALFEAGVAHEKLGRPGQAVASYEAAIDLSPKHDHLAARAGVARLYIMSGLPDRALELLKLALEQHPDDPTLLALRAVARKRQGDTVGALADAERAVKLAPDQELAVAVLSGLYLSAGDKARARTIIEQAVARLPKSVDLRLVLVRIYILDDDKPDAEAVLRELVRIKPHDAAHRVRLGQFYARTERPDDAEATYRQAIRDIPDDDGLKLSLIDFLATQRGDAVAERQLLRLIAESNHDSQLEFALAKFYESRGHPEQAETVFRQVMGREGLNAAGFLARDQLANLYVREKNVPAAINLVNEVLEKSPRDSDALFLRGVVSLAQGNPRPAIADLRAVLRDQPNSPWALRALARAHLANGEPDEAEQILRRSVEAAPNDLPSHLELAQLFIGIGKIEQAESLLAGVVNEHPDSAEAADLQFQVSMTTRDYAAAESAANALLAMRPKQAMPYLYEGRLAQARGHLDKAIDWYSKGVEAQPDALEPLTEQIRLIYSVKGAGAAMKQLEEFSSRYADNPLGPDAKGELLMREGKVSAAREAFEAAIRRAPKWWIAYRDLASEQLADKEYDAAIATLRNAEKVVDAPEAIDLELAQALERIDKTDAAIAEYEELLHRYPQADLAANNLARLLATYKSDNASLDRAKVLAARFAQSANPSFLDTYGWVLYKRGEVAASVPVLERVVATVSNDPVAHYHLGMAQSQLGKKSAARDNLALAVKSGRKFAGLEEAKSTLEKLDQPSPKS